MKEDRALIRLDTIIAVCAMIATCIAAGAMVYQTRVLADQFSATVWPYLTVQTNFYPGRVELRLVNDGAGPALVRSAQLTIDGKAVPSWLDLVNLVAPNRRAARKAGVSMTLSSIDSATTIRSGDSIGLIAARARDPRILRVWTKHRIALSFCYCSINNRCWTMQDVVNSQNNMAPVPTSACPPGEAIGVGTTP